MTTSNPGSRMRSTNQAGEAETLPGYGWIFPLGDGTVNIGAGLLDSSPAIRDPSTCAR